MQGGYNTAHACGVENQLAVTSIGTSVEVTTEDVGTFGVDIEQTTELTELERQFIVEGIDVSIEDEQASAESSTSSSSSTFDGGISSSPSAGGGVTAGSSGTAGSTTANGSATTDGSSATASGSAQNDNGSLESA